MIVIVISEELGGGKGRRRGGWGEQEGEGQGRLHGMNSASNSAYRKTTAFGSFFFGGERGEASVDRVTI